VEKTEEKALELLERRAVEGFIPCKQALRISDETGVSTRRIGAMIDESGIKITECQFGCFGWKQENPR